MKSVDNLIGNSKSMKDFMGNTYYYDCLGCEIGKKNIIPPGGVIYEDESFVLAGDPEIPLNGFLIISAKQHKNSLIEFTKDEQHNLIDIVSKSITILKKLGITKEVTLVQEERSKHFHMWIFPNQEWMTEKFGKGVAYVRDICEYARKNTTQDEKVEIINTIEKIKEEYNK